MQWSQVLEDPSLKDLPYKIELNEWGQIVMSPASNKQAFLQAGMIMILANQLSGGRVLTECSIATDKGVKVPDVVWCSSAFLHRYGFETPYPKAPEICVEILSPSNSNEEMLAKLSLYIEQGAQEVWIVSEAGGVTIHGYSGQLTESQFGHFDWYPLTDF